VGGVFPAPTGVQRILTPSERQAQRQVKFIIPHPGIITFLKFNQETNLNFISNQVKFKLVLRTADQDQRVDNWPKSVHKYVCLNGCS